MHELNGPDQDKSFIQWTFLHLWQLSITASHGQCLHALVQLIKLRLQHATQRHRPRDNHRHTGLLITRQPQPMLSNVVCKPLQQSSYTKLLHDGLGPRRKHLGGNETRSFPINQAFYVKELKALTACVQSHCCQCMLQQSAINTYGDKPPKSHHTHVRIYHVTFCLCVQFVI